MLEEMLKTKQNEMDNQKNEVVYEINDFENSVVN